MHFSVESLSGFGTGGAQGVVSGALPPVYEDRNGQCENLATNLCHKFEDVFRNSTPLLRVASLSALAPGTFYADYAANRVYVRDNPAGVTMQIGRTPAAISVGGATDVVVRDLGVRYFASPSQLGALEIGHRWKVFSVETSCNHALGFKVIGDHASFTAGRSSYNGQLGGGITNVHDNFGIGIWADGQAGDPAVANSLRFLNNSRPARRCQHRRQLVGRRGGLRQHREPQPQRHRWPGTPGP